jgi:hypothetical protein
MIIKNRWILVVLIILSSLVLQACTGNSNRDQMQATLEAAQIMLSVEQTRSAELLDKIIHDSQQNPIETLSSTDTPILPTPTTVPTETPAILPTDTLVPVTATLEPTLTPFLIPSSTPAATLDRNAVYAVTIRNGYLRTIWVLFAGRTLTMNISVAEKTLAVRAGTHPIKWECWTGWTTPNIKGSSSVTIDSNRTLTINSRCGLDVR